MTRTAKPRFAAILLLLLASTPVLAQGQGESAIDPAPPAGIAADEIIRRVAAKESEFAKARENYTYRQDVKVQTMEANSVDGEYHQVTDITFDARGKRIQNVQYAPMSTLQRIQMTQDDINDIENLYPFVLTTAEIPLYAVNYVGRQRVDELTTYVFDLAPKQIEKNRRYFQGRVWVDDRDLQIVKTSGKPVFVRKDEQEFPSYTSYREQIDGNYWFPTYVRAQEVLKFKDKRGNIQNEVPIRITVKYTEYKRFGSASRIIYEGQEIEKPKEPGQTPPPPPR